LSPESPERGRRRTSGDKPLPKIRPVLLALLLLLPSTLVRAQESSSHLGIRAVLPTGDLDRLYSSGFGFTGSTLYEAGDRVALIFEASWHRLLADESDTTGTGIPLEDADIFGFTLGPVLDLAPLAVGIKGGYFFGDFDEWDVMPFAQVVLGRFTLGVEYKALGTANWASGYVNFRWN
jgi:hypothetical protein